MCVLGYEITSRCHCEPVTDVTGVAIPQLDGKTRIYEMFENLGDSHASVCTGSE